MKFLRNLLGLVVNDWQLKLIALLLAIVIYHADKSDTAHNPNSTTNDRPLIQIR